MRRKNRILISILAAAALLAGLFSAVYGKSLWKDGLNVYRLSVKKGEIVKIRFSEKTIMKYKVEQKQNNYQSTKGKKGGGNLFSFFPDTEVNENDTLRNQNNVSINNENNFVIPARVTAAEGDLVSIEGVNSSLVNGEKFQIKFGGQFDVSSMNSDRSVLSTEIYDLNFQITKEPPVNTDLFSEKDMVFATNYTELMTNTTVSNNVTNLTVVTNLSSLKLEFKGIQDEKKKQILVNYMNFIVNSLFH
jgi:hypothetical protein